MRTQLFGAVGAFALVASALVAPAVSNASPDDGGIPCAADPSACMGVNDSPNGNEVVLGGECGPNTVWNSGLNQCVMAGPGFADPTGPVQSGEQLDPTGPVQSSEHLIPCAAATGFTSTPEPGEPCG